MSHDTYWRDNAACANNSAPFDYDNQWAEIEAKAICNGQPGEEPCPVRMSCLLAALDEEKDEPRSHQIAAPVRGGLNGTERANLVKKQKKKAAA